MNEQSSPRVSVIIATKNSELYLAQAMSSVAAQTLQDFEVIVVDGASRDDSVRIAQSFPKTRCIQQTSTGFAPAWNEGIEVSRGSFIAILDSDDVWHSDKLEKQVAHFANHPETDCVVGRVQFFLEQEDVVPSGFKKSLLNETHVAFMPGTAMIRREVFDRLGKFEDKWKIVSDLVWFANLRRAVANTAVIDATLLRKRVHGENLSYVTSGPVYRAELFQHLRESLIKRREPAALKGKP